MYSLKVMLLLGGWTLILAAAAVVGDDLYRAWTDWRGDPARTFRRPRLRVPAQLVGVAIATLLVHQSIVIVPSGFAGVRVSQLSGTRPGTLQPGVHFVKPLLERIVLFDTRDHVLATSAEGKEASGLHVQSKEGLQVGVAVTVRYRLEPSKLDDIHAHLPAPVEHELVPPVVASVFRELVPRYTVREVFSTRQLQDHGWTLPPAPLRSLRPLR